jgi:hypothetical protein
MKAEKSSSQTLTDSIKKISEEVVVPNWPIEKDCSTCAHCETAGCGHSDGGGCVFYDPRKEREMSEAKEVIRAWIIGLDGTEVYVAHSEEEMRQYYTDLVGAEDAAEDLAKNFTEIPQDQMDEELNFKQENPVTGKVETVTTTYRKLAEEGDIPSQIVSGCY